MKELDMRGKQCPMPVIEAKKALDREPGDLLKVRVDNEIAVENLKKLALSRGVRPEILKMDENDFSVLIPGAEAGDTQVQGISETAGDDVREADGEVSIKTVGNDRILEHFGIRAGNGTVVVIASDRMGEPEEELGRVLIKGFIYALSSQDQLPETIIFYNGGAKLTCEDSDSLSDLQIMETQGVEILTCGTCLKHLGLENSLKVGTVSNMYDIVERMTEADKVIRP